MTGLFNGVVTPIGQVSELLAYLIEKIPSLTILAVTDDGQRIPEEGYTDFPDDLVHRLAASTEQQADTTAETFASDACDGEYAQSTLSPAGTYRLITEPTTDDDNTPK